MSNAFDPYHKWLGIPRHEQPPHYYRLLAIPLFEDDLQVIATAADRQMTFLRGLQTGEHAVEARELLNEIARARLCLLKPETKFQYDSRLKLLLNQASTHDEEAEDVEAASDSAPPAQPLWQQPAILAGVAVITLIFLGSVFLFQNSEPPQPAAHTVAGGAGIPEAQPVDSNPGVAARRQPLHSAEDQSPSEVAASASGLPVNLISKIDLSRDVLDGTWNIDHGKLDSGNGRSDRIQIPGAVPSSYTLTIVTDRIERRVRGLTAYLPIGGHTVAAVVDGWNGEISGLELLNGRDGDRNETTTVGLRTQRGGNTLVYQVQPNQILVMVNGQKVIEWSGDPAVFSLAKHSGLPRPNELALGSCTSQWKISSITLVPKPVTPVGPKVAVAKPSFQAPVIDAQDNWIAKIDPVKDAVQGTWNLAGGVLLAPGGHHDRIRLPGKAPATYTLTIIAERLIETGYGLSPILPIGKGQVIARIDGWDGRTSGLERIGGVSGQENESTTYGQLTKLGLNTFICRVAPDRVHVEVNGRLAIDWSGDPTKLAVDPLYALPQMDEIGIAGGWTEWKIRGIKLESADSSSPAEMPPKTNDKSSPAAGPALAGTQPVPDASARDAARKALQERFTDESAKAQKGDRKLAWARTLLAEGQQSGVDPATCYVLLSESADRAAAAGNFGAAWEAIAALKKRFSIDHVPLLENAAKTVSSAVKTFDDMREFMAAHLQIANEAVQDDDFSTATAVLQMATTTAKKSTYADFREQIAAEKKRIEAAHAHFEVARLDREKLQANPTDPSANASWGFYLCCRRNDWAAGLPFLAQASNDVWGPLAQQELRLKQKPDLLDEQQLAKLGDDWWDAAEKQPEPFRSTIQDHALNVYLLAQDGLDGTGRSLIQERVDRVFGGARFLSISPNDLAENIAPAELNPVA
ncbi:MAG: hypothetical protein V4719_26330, partial [Planctomycetota bacterium]